MTSAVRLAKPASLTARVVRRRSPLRRMDWLLTGAVLALAVVGALLVWSATRPAQVATGADPRAYLDRHLLNLAIGLLLGGVTAFFDHRMLRAYAPVVYLASCAGLVAVLLIGTTINGAHSWIVLGGGFQIQPSEFAKVGLVVSMAMLLGERPRSQFDGDVGPRDVDVVLALVLAVVPLGLVMLQPDLGTTMVLVVIILGVIALSGAPLRWVVGLVIAGALAGFLAVHLELLQAYQVDRFTAFLHPAADAQGAGYTTQQARIAIGSGGLTGTGLFHGSQTNGQFVPEQQTDFIFTAAGEQLGFIGAGVIVLLFGVVLWRGARIAARAPDLFGRLIAAGVVSWLAFQTFVNIGMTLGIMPVTGLPLPFVSYGGSAMFANLVAIGLLQNVHLRTTAP